MACQNNLIVIGNMGAQQLPCEEVLLLGEHRSTGER
jgi:hypothetical protein